MRNTSKMRKVSAAVLVAAILMVFVMIFVTRTPRSESPPQAAVEPQVAEQQVTDGELVDAADVNSVADPATEALRSPVADEPSGDVYRPDRPCSRRRPQRDASPAPTGTRPPRPSSWR